MAATARLDRGRPGVRSWIRTPSRTHASCSPQASLAGCTSATPSRSSSAAEVGRRVHLRLDRVAVEQLEPCPCSRRQRRARRAARRPATASTATLKLAGALELRVDRRSARASPRSRRGSRAPSRSSRSSSAREPVEPVAEAVGQAGRAETAVAAGRGPAERCAPRAARRRGRGRAPWPAGRSTARSSRRPRRPGRPAPPRPGRDGSTARQVVEPERDGTRVGDRGEERGIRTPAASRPCTGRRSRGRQPAAALATREPTEDDQQQRDEEHRRPDDVDLGGQAALVRRPRRTAGRSGPGRR